MQERDERSSFRSALAGTLLPNRYGRAEAHYLGTVHTIAVFGLLYLLVNLHFQSQHFFSFISFLEPFAVGHIHGYSLLTTGLFLFNGWFLDHRLSLDQSTISRVPIWLRVIRFLFAGIPLFGVYILPIWSWLQERSAKKAQRGPRDSSMLSMQLPTPQWIRWSPSVHLLHYALNLLIPAGWLAWICTTPLGPHVKALLSALSLAAIQLDIVVRFRRGLDLRYKTFFMEVFSLLLLLPWPWPGFGSLGYLALRVLTLRPKLRMQAFFQSRSTINHRVREAPRRDWWRASRYSHWRLPAWLTRTDESGNEEVGLALFYHLKTTLTAIDSIGLVVVLYFFGQRYPVGGALLLSFLAMGLFVLVLLLVSGLLALSLDFVVSRLGWQRLLEPTIQSSLKYMTCSQLLALLGLYIGFLLVRWDARRLGIFLLVVGLVPGITASILDLLPITSAATRKPAVRTLWWGAALLAVSLFGWQIMANKLHAEVFMRLLALLGLSSPILAFAMGLTLGKRLRVPSGVPTLLIRRALLFCRAMSFLPLGGLTVPLWVLLRQRASAQIASSLLEATRLPATEKDEKPMATAGLRPCLLTREGRTYVFSHLLAHLDEAGNRNKMFELLEKTSFLKEQVIHFANFQKSSEDLERYVVPSAIEESDWRRFLRFMLLALHLRGAAEDIVELIEPLARSGRVEVALSIVDRIADPSDRCTAKAMIASTLEHNSEIYQRLARSLTYDLAALQLPSDSTLAEILMPQIGCSLIVTAQEFGTDVAAPLEKALERWPFFKNLVWMSVASCQAKRYGLLDSRFWVALCDVEDLDALKEFLPLLLIEAEPLPEPEYFLQMVGILSEDEQLLWLCRFALLGRLAASSSEHSWNLWRSWSTGDPIPWSPEVVEQAAPFLQSMNSHQLSQIIYEIGDDEMRAAACMTILLPQSSREAIHLVQTLITRIQAEDRQLHWKLRFLEKCSGSLQMEQEIRAILYASRIHGHELASDDFRRLLELIALFLPEDLEKEAEQILHQMDGLPTLLNIAKNSKCVPLLAYLLDHLDEYLLPYSMPEAQSFQLWCDLRKQIVSRLCGLEGDLSYLTKAIALNSEQADELRAETVAALVDSGHLTAAKSLCRLIISSSLRRRTHLKLLKKGAQEENLFEPSALFDSMYPDEWVQDEIRGLRALWTSEATPAYMLHVPVSPIQDRQHQYLTLFRLARRFLSLTGRSDSREILERLVQSAGLVVSDAQLLAMAPEVTYMIAPYSGRQCILEIRETLEHMVSLQAAPWSLRRELVETYLASVLPLLSERADKGSLRSEAANVAQMFVDLMDQLAHGSNPAIEERGLIPVLFAVIDRLPMKVMEHFLRQSTPSEYLWLYLQGRDELFAEWDRQVEQDKPDPLILETILYLLSYWGTESLPAALGLLPEGAFKDRLCSSMVRHGWLPLELSDEVIQLIGAPAVRLSLEIWLGLSCAPSSEGEKNWLQALASLSTFQFVESNDPRIEPWLRKLWTINPERSRPILARAALQALTNGGHLHGRIALCLWLHSHLAPDSGDDQAKMLAHCTEAEQAVEQALTLPAISPSTNA